MTALPRVAVVGAGIVGLATATALIDSGAEVLLYERGVPGQEQSKGRTRVFRVAHGEPRLVDLALRSRRLWHEWETRFRRRLIGDEGLVITGHEQVAGWTAAMSDAGAPHTVLDIDEAVERIPIARLAGTSALFDPSAGPTRARRTVELLQSLCSDCLRLEEVLEIAAGTSGCRLTTAAGAWECDEVIITAGVETSRLATPAGLDYALSVVHDSRFTYTVKAPYCHRSLACWFDASEVYGGGCTSYGQRVGSTDLYAVGVGWGDVDGLTPDEESAMHRERAAVYIREAYPGLDPVPVDEIRCSYLSGAVREDGDGFVARRSGSVTALYGTNLFKFAPLLGRLLCQTAMAGELAPELALAELAAKPR